MSEKEWWYRVADRQVGPIAWESLRDLAQQGLLRQADAVWRSGQPEWVPAGTVAGLFPGAAAATPTTDLPRIPPPMPSPLEAASREPQVASQLASPWLRLAGQFIDACVVWAAIVLAFGWVSLVDADVEDFVTLFVLLYLLAGGYILLADGLPGGQSLGKRLLGMRVIKEQTRLPCSYWDSFLRNILLAILGPIDWLFIVGQKRQRLGDRAAGTLVLKTER